MSKTRDHMMVPASPTGRYIDSIDPDDPEYIKNRQRPAAVKEDLQQMEHRSRVSSILNSQAFKEELEQVVLEQFHSGPYPESLITLQQITNMLLPGSSVGSACLSRAFTVTPIDDLKGASDLNLAKGERLLRCKLAVLYRLMDLCGWSQSIYYQITARVSSDHEHFLVNPFGLSYCEVTASSLVKVDAEGDLLQPDHTLLGVNKAAFAIHATIHQARPDIRCIVHVHTPAAIAVSTLKCGLLAMSREAVVCGQVSYYDFQGVVALDVEEQERLANSFGAQSRVLVLGNYGILACGETVEETFHLTVNVVAACETQIRALPVGLDNIVIPDRETQALSFVGSKVTTLAGRKWRTGELEFEALMRTLDNLGLRTGHTYKLPSVKKQKKVNDYGDVQIPPSLSTLAVDGVDGRAEFTGSPVDRQKKAQLASWLITPNSYRKTEFQEVDSRSPKKITKWVPEVEPDRSGATPVRVDNPNQFAPQGDNPREFKDKQRNIRKNYYEETVTPGPQAKVLEDVRFNEEDFIPNPNLKFNLDTTLEDESITPGPQSRILRGFLADEANQSKYFDSAHWNNEKTTPETVFLRNFTWDDHVTPGPASKVLKGFTWDDNFSPVFQSQSIGGRAWDDVDSRQVAPEQNGLDHRHDMTNAAPKEIPSSHKKQPQNAVVYRHYYAANPFENITDAEIMQYQKEVERKERVESVENLISQRREFPQEAAGPHPHIQAEEVKHHKKKKVKVSEARRRERHDARTTVTDLSPASTGQEDTLLAGLAERLVRSAIFDALSVASQGKGRYIPKTPESQSQHFSFQHSLKGSQILSHFISLKETTQSNNTPFSVCFENNNLNTCSDFHKIETTESLACYTPKTEIRRVATEAMCTCHREVPTNFTFSCHGDVGASGQHHYSDNGIAGVAEFSYCCDIGAAGVGQYTDVGATGLCQCTDVGAAGVCQYTDDGAAGVCQYTDDGAAGVCQYTDVGATGLGQYTDIGAAGLSLCSDVGAAQVLRNYEDSSKARATCFKLMRGYIPAECAGVEVSPSCSPCGQCGLTRESCWHEQGCVCGQRKPVSGCSAKQSDSHIVMKHTHRTLNQKNSDGSYLLATKEFKIPRHEVMEKAVHSSTSSCRTPSNLTDSTTVEKKDATHGELCPLIQTKQDLAYWDIFNWSNWKHFRPPDIVAFPVSRDRFTSRSANQTQNSVQSRALESPPASNSSPPSGRASGQKWVPKQRNERRQQNASSQEPEVGSATDRDFVRRENKILTERNFGRQGQRVDTDPLDTVQKEHALRKEREDKRVRRNEEARALLRQTYGEDYDRQQEDRVSVHSGQRGYRSLSGENRSRSTGEEASRQHGRHYDRKDKPTYHEKENTDKRLNASLDRIYQSEHSTRRVMADTESSGEEHSFRNASDRNLNDSRDSQTPVIPAKSKESDRLIRELKDKIEDRKSRILLQAQSLDSEKHLHVFKNTGGEAYRPAGENVVNKSVTAEKYDVSQTSTRRLKPDVTDSTGGTRQATSTTVGSSDRNYIRDAGRDLIEADEIKQLGNSAGAFGHRDQTRDGVQDGRLWVDTHSIDHGESSTQNCRTIIESRDRADREYQEQLSHEDKGSGLSQNKSNQRQKSTDNKMDTDSERDLNVRNRVADYQKNSSRENENNIGEKVENSQGFDRDIKGPSDKDKLTRKTENISQDKNVTRNDTHGEDGEKKDVSLDKNQADDVGRDEDRQKKKSERRGDGSRGRGKSNRREDVNGQRQSDEIVDATLVGADREEVRNESIDKDRGRDERKNRRHSGRRHRNEEEERDESRERRRSKGRSRQRDDNYEVIDINRSTRNEGRDKRRDTERDRRGKEDQDRKDEGIERREKRRDRGYEGRNKAERGRDKGKEDRDRIYEDRDRRNEDRDRRYKDRERGDEDRDRRNRGRDRKKDDRDRRDTEIGSETQDTVKEDPDREMKRDELKDKRRHERRDRSEGERSRKSEGRERSGDSRRRRGLSCGEKLDENSEDDKKNGRVNKDKLISEKKDQEGKGKEQEKDERTDEDRNKGKERRERSRNNDKKEKERRHRQSEGREEEPDKEQKRNASKKGQRRAENRTEDVGDEPEKLVEASHLDVKIVDKQDHSNEKQRNESVSDQRSKERHSRNQTRGKSEDRQRHSVKEEGTKQLATSDDEKEKRKMEAASEDTEAKMDQKDLLSIELKSSDPVSTGAFKRNYSMTKTEQRNLKENSQNLDSSNVLRKLKESSHNVENSKEQRKLKESSHNTENSKEQRKLKESSHNVENSKEQRKLKESSHNVENSKELRKLKESSHNVDSSKEQRKFKEGKHNLDNFLKPSADHEAVTESVLNSPVVTTDVDYSSRKDISLKVDHMPTHVTDIEQRSHMPDWKQNVSARTELHEDSVRKQTAKKQHEDVKFDVEKMATQTGGQFKNSWVSHLQESVESAKVSAPMLAEENMPELEHFKKPNVSSDINAAQKFDLISDFNASKKFDLRSPTDTKKIGMTSHVDKSLQSVAMLEQTELVVGKVVLYAPPQKEAVQHLDSKLQLESNKTKSMTMGSSFLDENVISHVRNVTDKHIEFAAKDVNKKHTTQHIVKDEETNIIAHREPNYTFQRKQKDPIVTGERELKSVRSSPRFESSVSQIKDSASSNISDELGIGLLEEGQALPKSVTSFGKNYQTTIDSGITVKRVNLGDEVKSLQSELGHGVKGSLEADNLLPDVRVKYSGAEFEQEDTSRIKHKTGRERSTRAPLVHPDINLDTNRETVQTDVVTKDKDDPGFLQKVVGKSGFDGRNQTAVNTNIADIIRATRPYLQKVDDVNLQGKMVARSELPEVRITSQPEMAIKVDHQKKSSDHKYTSVQTDLSDKIREEKKYMESNIDDFLEEEVISVDKIPKDISRAVASRANTKANPMKLETDVDTDVFGSLKRNTHFSSNQKQTTNLGLDASPKLETNIDSEIDPHLKLETQVKSYANTKLQLETDIDSELSSKPKLETKVDSDSRFGLERSIVADLPKIFKAQKHLDMPPLQNHISKAVETKLENEISEESITNVGGEIISNVHEDMSGNLNLNEENNQNSRSRERNQWKAPNKRINSVSSDRNVKANVDDSNNAISILPGKKQFTADVDDENLGIDNFSPRRKPPTSLNVTKVKDPLLHDAREITSKTLESVITTTKEPLKYQPSYRTKNDLRDSEISLKTVTVSKDSEITQNVSAIHKDLSPPADLLLERTNGDVRNVRRSTSGDRTWTNSNRRGDLSPSADIQLKNEDSVKNVRRSTSGDRTWTTSDRRGDLSPSADVQLKNEDSVRNIRRSTSGDRTWTTSDRRGDMSPSADIQLKNEDSVRNFRRSTSGDRTRTNSNRRGDLSPSADIQLKNEDSVRNVRRSTSGDRTWTTPGRREDMSPSADVQFINGNNIRTDPRSLSGDKSRTSEIDLGARGLIERPLLAKRDSWEDSAGSRRRQEKDFSTTRPKITLQSSARNSEEPERSYPVRKERNFSSKDMGNDDLPLPRNSDKVRFSSQVSPQPRPASRAVGKHNFNHAGDSGSDVDVDVRSAPVSRSRTAPDSHMEKPGKEFNEVRMDKRLHGAVSLSDKYSGVNDMNVDDKVPETNLNSKERQQYAGFVKRTGRGGRKSIPMRGVSLEEDDSDLPLGRKFEESRKIGKENKVNDVPEVEPESNIREYFGSVIEDNPIELNMEEGNNESPTSPKKGIFGLFSCMGGKSSDIPKFMQKSKKKRSTAYYEEGEKRKIKKLSKEKEKEEKKVMYFEKSEEILPEIEVDKQDQEGSVETLSDLSQQAPPPLPDLPPPTGRFSVDRSSRFKKRPPPFRPPKVPSVSDQTEDLEVSKSVVSDDDRGTHDTSDDAVRSASPDESENYFQSRRDAKLSSFMSFGKSNIAANTRQTSSGLFGARQNSGAENTAEHNVPDNPDPTLSQLSEVADHVQLRHSREIKQDSDVKPIIAPTAQPRQSSLLAEVLRENKTSAPEPVLRQSIISQDSNAGSRLSDFIANIPPPENYSDDDIYDSTFDMSTTFDTSFPAPPT